MKILIESCDRNLVMLDLPAHSLEEAVGLMLDELVRKDELDASVLPDIRAEVQRKEARSASAIGHSLAVPHCYLDRIEKPVVAIARLRHGVNMGAPDGTPVRFVFLLLGPRGVTSEHLDTLANVARLMSDDEFRYLASEAKHATEFRQAIASCLGEPPAKVRTPPVEDGLQYTGRPFGGLIADVRRRLPHYVSDFKDGLHSKCLGSTLFLFFACLAPAIIFGGLMHGETRGDIGAVEMIVATTFCGLVYSVIAGQPLIILGGTGPMLIFTGILYKFCEQNGIAFLPVYAWVGIWTGLILLLLAFTDASCLMRYFTRFTDEIFAALISVIFIVEAIEKLIHIFHEAENVDTIGHDVAMFSLILALGTFYIASSLSRFRKSHLLVPTVREFLADFGPTIAILAMAAIAYYWHDTITLAPLPAPDHFQTTSGRPWLVSFLDVPPKLIGLTLIPAFLCTVLVFLDQNITARLVNSRDNNLQKGESYHLDLAVVGGLVAVCSVFGLPWLVAATVRSLNHVRSLATTEEVFDKMGQAHTHILHVRENRVTAIAIHV
ncbi:PTS sugar transporter subunit IIA, partial [Planctomycetota bacterium]